MARHDQAMKLCGFHKNEQADEPRGNWTRKTLFFLRLPRLLEDQVSGGWVEWSEPPSNGPRGESSLFKSHARLASTPPLSERKNKLTVLPFAFFDGFGFAGLRVRATWAYLRLVFLFL